MPTPLRPPSRRAHGHGPRDDDDDLSGDPSPGAEHDVATERVADRRRRRSLATIVVVTGGATWILLVGTVCLVSLILAVFHPTQLEGFALAAYPSVGGATVVVAIIQRLVTCLDH